MRKQLVLVLCSIASLVCALGLADDINETFRLNLADYQPERRVEMADAFDGQAAKLPAAFGIHHYGAFSPDNSQTDENGETIPIVKGAYYNRACFHVRSSKTEKITIVQNRVFEEIGPERVNHEVGPIVVEGDVDIEPVVREISNEWSWIVLRVSPFMQELRFELLGSEDAVCDAVVFANTDDFDINAFDRDAILKFQYRAPRAAYADRLFETNPLMPLQEYAETVARHLGCEPQKQERKFIDENGACLLPDGKPFFPMMIFHSNINDWQTNQLPLNVCPDGAWLHDERPNYRKYNQVGFYSRDCCYEDFTVYARNQDNNWINPNGAIYYLYDEPDLVYDPIALERLNKLEKVVSPRHPTLYIFCVFRNPPNSYRASDYVGFDHYPIGEKTTWHSVEAIGWIVDRLRWSSGNHPVIFTVQTNPGLQGVWPDRRAHACMSLLPVAHGARGLYFYTWNEFGNGTLQEKNPECYENFKEIVFLLASMEDALVGPEVFLPWDADGEAKARLAISADRKNAYLIVANSKMHRTTLTLAPKSDSPLSGLTFEERFCDGVKADLTSDVLSFDMEKYGSAVFKVEGNGLDKLVKMTDEDVMNALKDYASNLDNASLATVEQTETWRREEAENNAENAE